jgi:hypothetical protein
MQSRSPSSHERTTRWPSDLFSTRPRVRSADFRNGLNTYKLSYVKRICIVVAFVALAEVAAAQTVPVPRPRPFLTTDPAALGRTDSTPTPSACRLRLTTARAIAPSVDSIDGPEGCGSADLVRLEAVMLSNSDRVDISPPAVLRCEMAEAIADWLRDDLARLGTLNFGSRLRSVRNYTAYHCRTRNNTVGGLMSEHGKGNALDVGSIKLIDGRTIDPTDLKVSPDFREAWKKSACGRFSTVLGPGSDGYHENHVHLDLKERQNGYKICQWEIRVPGESLQLAIASDVPLPRPRPKVLPTRPRK